MKDLYNSKFAHHLAVVQQKTSYITPALRQAIMAYSIAQANFENESRCESTCISSLPDSLNNGDPETETIHHRVIDASFELRGGYLFERKAAKHKHNLDLIQSIQL
ncbi:MAG: hypothetical protein AAF629_13980 [Chloroflexota bacterium]